MIICRSIQYEISISLKIQINWREHDHKFKGLKILYRFGALYQWFLTHMTNQILWHSSCSWVKPEDPIVLYVLESFPFFERWGRNREEDSDSAKQSSSTLYHEQHSSLPWAWLHTSNLALREYNVGCIIVLYHIQWYQT